MKRKEEGGRRKEEEGRKKEGGGRLTSSTEASYISKNFSERGTSLMEKFTPAKLSWRAAYIPRSWHKKQTATSHRQWNLCTRLTTM